MNSKVRRLHRGIFATWMVLFLILMSVQTSAASPPAQGTTPGTGAATGNPENGRALFVEDVELENGGPACVGCHSVDDIGILGGGVVGPDLTQVYERYGEHELRLALADIAFPTMRPIYANHPLTESEQADLVAFFQSVASQPQADKTLLVLAASLAGFVAAMALAAFYWRHRLGFVRRRLVEKVQHKSTHS